MGMEFKRCGNLPDMKGLMKGAVKLHYGKCMILRWPIVQTKSQDLSRSDFDRSFAHKSLNFKEAQFKTSTLLL